MDNEYITITQLFLNIKNGLERSYLLENLRKKIDELEIAQKELQKYHISLSH